jgi:hypothetical protein
MTTLTRDMSLSASTRRSLWPFQVGAIIAALQKRAPRLCRRRDARGPRPHQHKFGTCEGKCSS